MCLKLIFLLQVSFSSNFVLNCVSSLSKFNTVFLPDSTNFLVFFQVVG